MKYIFTVSSDEAKPIAQLTGEYDQLITQDTFPAREQRDGFKAVLSYNETDGVYWDYIPLTGEEKREEAYRTEKNIWYDGMNLTVDEANAYWQMYMAEGSSRADDITALIATAKADIRTRFPD
jgi:hypothetical protein